MKRFRSAACGFLGTAILFLTACNTQTTAGKPAVSGLQMDVFNQDLTFSEQNDKYRTTYEIFVYSFCDSDGDGIGDLNGVTSKLDYIASLGFSAIWLTPIASSPTYHKYDVQDYMAVDESFGSIGDFERLVEECHKRGIFVYTDLVLNHTSSSHPWFESASQSIRNGEENPYIRYYHFSEEAKDGYVPLPDSDWYYEARFWSEMPDLNLEEDAVKDEIDKIVSFWLEKGVDGFRLDAVTSYFTGEPEKNKEFLQWLVSICRKKKEDCYLVAEAWTDRGAISGLYESGIDSLFDFPYADADGIIRNVMNGTYGADDFINSLVKTEEIYSQSNPGFIDAPFYTNHDTARSAGYYASDEGPATKMAYGLSLLMGGNSFVYYGEEIGMKGSGKDENKRAPMYWSDEENAEGLCAGPPGMDNVTMKFPSAAIQQDDPESILNWFRQVIHVRRSFPLIAEGRTIAVSELCDHDVGVMIKEKDGTRIMVAVNLRAEVRDVNLQKFASFQLGAVLNTSSEEISLSDGILHLPGCSIAVLEETD